MTNALQDLQAYTERGLSYFSVVLKMVTVMHEQDKTFQQLQYKMSLNIESKNYILTFQ